MSHPSGKAVHTKHTRRLRVKTPCLDAASLVSHWIHDVKTLTTAFCILNDNLVFYRDIQAKKNEEKKNAGMHVLALCMMKHWNSLSDA